MGSGKGRKREGLAFMLNCTFSTDPAAPVAAAAVASGRAEICAASRPSLPAGTDM